MTQKQVAAFEKKLKEYKKRFLGKDKQDLDEASTRLMINDFLSNLLGYAEFEEIKTEYRIKGTYTDYVIQLNRKKHLVVEVKAISIDLNQKHIRQAVGYAVDEGIEWVLLTNAKSFALYRVIFNKPIDYKKVFEYNLATESKLSKAATDLVILNKKNVEKGSLEKYWQRFSVLEPAGFSKILYYKNVISAIRRNVKAKSRFNFNQDRILDALHEVISSPIEHSRPKKPFETKQSTKRKG